MHNLETRMSQLERSNRRMRFALLVVALPYFLLLFGQGGVKGRVVADVVSANEITTRKLVVRGKDDAKLEAYEVDGEVHVVVHSRYGAAMQLHSAGIVIRNAHGATSTVVGQGVLHLSDPAAKDGADHRQIMIRAYKGGGGRLWMSAGLNTAFVVEGHPDRTIEAVLGEMGGRQVGWAFDPSTGARPVTK